MDKDKWKIWSSGITEEERDAIAKLETAENKFKEEKELVIKTVNTRGFKLIMEKLIAEVEGLKFKLITAKEKQVVDIQKEIKAKMDFIHSWDEFM